MTNTQLLTLPTYPTRGGRIHSETYRESIAFCEGFTGLEDGADRYSLLLLVKKVGRYAGFTPRMIQLLDYYMAYTRDFDWEVGGRPIVYQSLARTALDMGVTERQIQKLEQALFSVGAITWNDSGNHKRFGQRHPESGRIMFAYGVELTPLASLATSLDERLQEKELYDAAWLETKRQVSWYRHQICGSLREWQEEGASTDDLRNFSQRYEQIAIQIRTSVHLSALRTLLNRHSELHGELLEAMNIELVKSKQATEQSSIASRTYKCSSRGERKFTHKQNTTQEPFNKLNTSSPAGPAWQKSVADPAETFDPIQSSGLQHVKIGPAVNAASQHFRNHLPDDPDWLDVVEAASRVRRDLGISQTAWGNACQLLSRSGAALCVLITDQARWRSENKVRQPAAYFQGMLNRASTGDLRLHRSIFGLLECAKAPATSTVPSTGFIPPPSTET